MQQLINDLSKRIKSNEHRIADIMNQLDEMQATHSKPEDKIQAQAISEKKAEKDGKS